MQSLSHKSNNTDLKKTNKQTQDEQVIPTTKRKSTFTIEVIVLKFLL